MTWLSANLNERVQILLPRLDPNDDGGGNFIFDSAVDGESSPLKTVWMEFKPITFKGAGSAYIRGEQINENATHMFKVRKESVNDLGKEYGTGFSISFKFMPNLVGLKSDYYLLVQRGSTVKGRLFKIHDVTDNKEQREYLKVSAEEIEERGVGWGV